MILRPDGPGAREPTVPAPESGWSVPTRAAWRTFWRDGLARLTTPVDAVAVRRLFALYDARDRLWQLFLKSPRGMGSKGQEIMHPAGRLRWQLMPGSSGWSGHSASGRRRARRWASRSRKRKHRSRI
jgi:hypothetical protein